MDQNLEVGTALMPMLKTTGGGGGVNSMMTTKITLVRNTEYRVVNRKIRQQWRWGRGIIGLQAIHSAVKLSHKSLSDLPSHRK